MSGRGWAREIRGQVWQGGRVTDAGRLKIAITVALYAMNHNPAFAPRLPSAFCSLVRHHRGQTTPSRALTDVFSNTYRKEDEQPRILPAFWLHGAILPMVFVMLSNRNVHAHHEGNYASWPKHSIRFSEHLPTGASSG